MRRPTWMPCPSGTIVAITLASLAPCTQALAQTTIDEQARHALRETPRQGQFLTHLIEDTLIDFSRLPSRETATWIGIGAAIAAVGATADEPSSSIMSSSRSLETVFAPGERLGGARMQLAGAATTYLLGRLTGHSRISVLGSDLLRAQFVTQAVTAAFKMSARRERPDGTMFSFPSGHSSVSFATATVLQRHFGWKAGVPAYGFATYVAASRLQEKRHFLSDVAFGAALGIAVGRTVTIGRGDAQFAVSPVAVPGGAGVSFNWVGER